MPTAIHARLLLSVLVAASLTQSCLASDRLGRAGPIRSYGGTDCKAGFLAMMKGECDPPRIDADVPADQRAQARVARARQLLAIIRVPQALTELDDAIAEDPRNVPALMLRGRLNIVDRQNEAVRDMDAVLAIVPRNSDALATRAFALAGGDGPVALRDADMAVSCDPENAEALWIRATVLLKSHRYEDAERDLTSANALDPTDIRVLLLRAKLHMMNGKPREAEADATAALALRPDSDARHVRAVARGATGNFEGALDDLNAVLGTQGGPLVAPPAFGQDLVDLYVQRAIILSRMGKKEDAKRDLAMVIKRGGQRGILLAQVYLRSHGFPDVALDGAASDGLVDAMQACFIDEACGRDLTISAKDAQPA